MAKPSALASRPLDTRPATSHRRSKRAASGQRRTIGFAALLATFGLAVSVYLTAVHYASGSIPLACATGGIVNCEQVTSSAESMIGSVPVAVLGVLWFAIYLALALGGGSGPYRLAWSAAGLAFVFYLVYAELFLIGALCLWCTVVQVTVVALFLIDIAQSTTELVEAT